ncbi:MAG: hypothetical protein IT158_07535 [Bryobacterales bacterium]|nr:hypothetical protein [Bryobacterales bacterium]
MRRLLAFPAGLLLLSVAALPRQDQVVCGTSRLKWKEELHLHQQARKVRQARQKFSALSAGVRSAGRDYGEIAVLEDGDGVVARRNQFNLVSRTLGFLPAAPGASRYTFLVRENTYDAAAAEAGTRLTLADDDSREVTIPFPFPFFGGAYNRVFVNSDGNLTFGAPDTSSSERSLGRHASGSPRISGLFRDLDPSQSGAAVTVLAEAARLIVTWSRVPEYSEFSGAPRQTFQVRLYPDGGIEFAYQDVTTTSAVVGIAPGAMQDSTSVVSFVAGSSQEYTGAVAEVFRGDADEIDIVTAAQKFYETHDDAYDYLVFFNNQGIRAGESALAYESPVRTTATGFGDDLVDVGRQFGSPYRLQAVMNMGPLSQYPKDPNGIVQARRLSRDTPLTVLAHEAGHLFLAFASVRDAEAPDERPMLGYQSAHWIFTFNSEASLLEGNRIRDDGPAASPRFTTTATVEGFSPLDQYLMGLRSPDEVFDTFLVTGTNAALRAMKPQPGVSFSGERRDIRVQEVIEAEGRRTPDHTVAQRRFRFAFILIVRQGTEPSADDLAQVETYRREFEKFYSRATSERALADASLRRAVRLSVFPAAGVLEGGSATATASVQRPVSTALTLLLRAQNGYAGVPGSVTIPEGSSSVSFSISGQRAGVEELLVEPDNSAYETVHARIQVTNGASGLRLEAASGDKQAITPGVPQTDPVVVRLTDINRLPYPGVAIRAEAAGGGAVLPAVAVTDASGQASFQWTPGAAGQPQLRFSADGAAAALSVGAGGVPAMAGSAVVNAASGAALLSPGSIASVYGLNLAGGTTAATPYPWPERFAGIQVMLGGRLAPLLYVSDAQVNFLVPESLPVGVAEMTVTTPAGVSAPVRVRIVSVSPGIFAAVHSGTTDPASQRPARPGDYLEVYATGLGVARDFGSGLRETLIRPEVHIGGFAAGVTYSGLAPGFLGLYQVNVQVNEGTPPGLQPLTLTVDEVRSNPVMVAVGAATGE